MVGKEYAQTIAKNIGNLNKRSASRVGSSLPLTPLNRYEAGEFTKKEMDEQIHNVVTKSRYGTGARLLPLSSS